MNGAKSKAAFDGEHRSDVATAHNNCETCDARFSRAESFAGTLGISATQWTNYPEEVRPFMVFAGMTPRLNARLADAACVSTGVKTR